jgi:stage V sporulation protein AE
MYRSWGCFGKGEWKMSEYWIAFIIGGLICVIGQLLMDLTKLTPAHVMTLLVISGAVLDGFGLYDPLIKFAGAGATVPITSFGHALYHGAWQEIQRDGLIGIITGIFEIPSAGITAAIVFGFFGSLVFKPKG